VTRNVANRFLHEAVYKHITEMWPRVCYMKLCLDSDLKCSLEFLT